MNLTLDIEDVEGLIRTYNLCRNWCSISYVLIQGGRQLMRF